MIVAAVSAYPGGHAESYANQNIYGSNYDGGHDDHYEHYVSLSYMIQDQCTWSQIRSPGYLSALRYERCSVDRQLNDRESFIAESRDALSAIVQS